MVKERSYVLIALQIQNLSSAFVQLFDVRRSFLYFTGLIVMLSRSLTGASTVQPIKLFTHGGQKWFDQSSLNRV